MSLQYDLVCFDLPKHVLRWSPTTKETSTKLLALFQPPALNLRQAKPFWILLPDSEIKLVIS